MLKKGEYQWLDKLSAAIDSGRVQEDRLDDMVRRVTRTLIGSGVIDDSPEPGGAIDFAAHAAVSQADAEEGIVLLRNGGLLPLAKTTKKIALIGGHADVGVLTGGGSAQVYSPGGNQVRGLGPSSWPGPHVYAKSSILEALQAEFPGAQITFHDGRDVKAAAALARKSEVAIVVATQWTAENMDFSITLPDEQDALIEAVATANKKSIVVLETGGPVLMPWLARTAAVVEAWYPGTRGGPAIARVLSGAVNPSGRLPATFPKSLAQLPRPTSAGMGLPDKTRFDVKYDEGAAVGYRWFDEKKLEPEFPFGHGLSYTTFAFTQPTASVEVNELVVRFAVENTGKRVGKAVAQVYVSPEAGGWEAPQRLGAYAKAEVEPGSHHEFSLLVEPRLLATYDTNHHAFHIAAGKYTLKVAQSSRDPGQTVTVELPERFLPVGAGVISAR